MMKSELFKAQFANHFRDDLKERLVYSSDLGELPTAVRNMVNTTPDGVLRIQGREDLVQLVKLAKAEHTPLTPRGAGTSGFGSALPAKGGIVVDLSDLVAIIKVDESNQTVQVETGMTWLKLDKTLQTHKLRSRAHPTSAISATIGGWLALNGAGIGSFEYGRAINTVVGLTVVSPTGEILQPTGDAVKPYLGSEGILGFIVDATLKLRPLEDDDIIGFDFTSREDGVKFMIEAGALPIWNMAFTTGTFIRRDMQAQEETIPEKVPVLRILAVAPASRNITVAMTSLARKYKGTTMDRKLTEHTWNDRFHPMRMKTLGPSLVPSEAETTVATLDALLKDLEKQLPGMAFEGTFSSKDQLSLLGFALSDSRSLRYNVDFLKALKVLRLAQKHGGRPYGFGLYFAHAAKDNLENYDEVVALKAKLDPDNIMNPGKIVEHNQLLAMTMKTAEIFGPLAEKASGLLPSSPLLGGRLPAEVRDYAYACAQCGYCKTECTLSNADHWESMSPRGKFALLRLVDQGVMPLTQELVDTLLMCTTCKRCEPVCQLSLPIEKIWNDLREWLVSDKHRRTFAAFEMMAAALKHEGNIWAHYKEERDQWLPENAKYTESGPVGYWAGCTASFVTDDVARNAMRILNAGGIGPAYLGKSELCCGIPMLMAGLWDRWEDTMRANIQEINKRGIKEMIVSCPGCHVALSQHYKTWAEKLGLDWNVHIVHLSEKIVEMITENKLKFVKNVDTTVTWHDPCHIGRHAGIYNPPRETLQSIPGLKLVEMEHNKENSLCCGSVLTRISDTDISDKIAIRRFKEAEVAGAEEMITTCPCCELQLRIGRDACDSSVRIRDFATIVAEALGYPDETARIEIAVKTEWAVFEKMISAMSIQEMAKMMVVMMPRMMELLPDWMKSMMATTKPLSSGVKDKLLTGMKSIIPSMMPLLLPEMLPQMVPDVCRYMEKQAPGMPEAMRKLLPEMMPEVMSRLMPKVLDQLIPLFLDEMLVNMKSSLMTSGKN